MSHDALLNRALNALQQFKKPRTNCWCNRQDGETGVSSVHPPNSHSVQCLDLQRLEAELHEAINHS